MHSIRPFRRLALLLLPLSMLACSGGGTVPPADEEPTITVTGVQDGAVLEGPATISIAASPGTWQATLNGQPFFSGTTVSAPGSYTLVVTARNGTATAREEVRFEIRLGGASVLVVRMFDLGDNDAGGGGDAILLSDSSAAGWEHALVDAGPAGAGGSDEAFVQRRLADLGVDTLEALVLTHAHSDHYQGMEPVLEGTVVEDFVYNGQVRTLFGYESVLEEAAVRAGEVIVPTQTRAWEIGHGEEPTAMVVIPALADHLSDDTDDGSDLNDGSLGTSVTKGSFRMFLTGDGEVDANRRWRVDFPTLTSDLDVLKVGHHGANDAVFDEGFAGSGTTWLAHAAPEAQIISANGTTHPRIAALDALLGQTRRTYCTNVHGDIEIRVAPAGTFTVTVERNASIDCVAGSEATT